METASKIVSTRKQYPGKFGAFVSSFLAENLAVELDIDPTNIYAWLGGRYRPQVRYAVRIIQIARRAGTVLTLEDIYDQEIKSLFDKEKTRHAAILSRGSKEDRARRLGSATQRAREADPL